MRLHQDLAEFLTEGEADNRVVLQWKMAKVKMLVFQRYLLNSDHKQQLHKIMADYFIGTWGNGKKKSYRYMQQMANDTVVVMRMTSGQRYVPAQPLVWIDISKAKIVSRPNTRKLQELPYHLLYADRLSDLQHSVIFNYKWIHAVCKFVSVDSLIDSLEEASVMPHMRHNQELELLIETINDCRVILENNLNYLSSELTCRLIEHLGKLPYLTMLLKDCDNYGFYLNKIVPMTPFLASSKDEMVYAVKCDTGFDSHIAMAVTNMPDHVVTYTVADKLAIINMKSGDNVQLECSNKVFYSDLKASRFNEFIYGFNDGNTMYNHLENAPVLDVYDADSGQMIKRIHIPNTVTNQDVSRLRKLFRLTLHYHSKILFETQNHIAILYNTVKLCNVDSGLFVEELEWPFLLTWDERFLLTSNHDGCVWVRDFSDMNLIATLLTPKHVTVITVIRLTHTSDAFVLVAAGSYGTLNLFDIEDVVQGGEILPTYTTTLMTHKQPGCKGGIGHIIHSDDHRLILVVFLHSKGRDIFQTNYVMEADLAVVGSYDCGVGESAFFSACGKYLLHWEKNKNNITVFDTCSLSKCAIYNIGSISQCLPSKTGSNILLAVNNHLVEVNIEIIVKKENIKDGVVLSKEKDSNDQCTIKTPIQNKRAVMAELGSVSMEDLGNTIPLEIMYIRQDTGLVDSQTVTFDAGVHFSEFDIPAVSCENGITLTPDGQKILFVCDQIHIWLADRQTVSMAVPLHNKNSCSKLSVCSDPHSDIFVKNVPMNGLIMNKEDTIFLEHGFVKQILYKAKGGEIIQRIPSIIRIFDAISYMLFSTVRIQNEKLVACSNLQLTTTSLTKAFTTVYDMKTGEHVMTIEISCALSLFTPSGKVLLLVSKEMKNTIRIYSGKTFLDVRKARCSSTDSDHIVAIITCHVNPVQVIVHIVTQNNALYQNNPFPNLYVTVNLRDCHVINRMQCEHTLVHFSSNGLIAVDGDFVFYDMRTSQKMFRLPLNIADRCGMSSDLSYFSDSGNELVFLNTEEGTINLFDIQKQKLVSTCLYHKTMSTVHRLLRHQHITSLLPLFGGYQCVVIDGGILKQFLIQDFACWKSLTKNSHEVDHAYQGVAERAKYFQCQYGYNNSPVEISKFNNRLTFTNDVSLLRRSPNISLVPLTTHCSPIKQ